jgi:hypothetical protein
MGEKAKITLGNHVLELPPREIPCKEKSWSLNFEAVQ